MLSAEFFSHHSPRETTRAEPADRAEDETREPRRRRKTNRRAATRRNKKPWRFARTFAAIFFLEHARREFPEERDERPRRGRDGFIPRALVLREILEQIFVHHQRTPQANLAHGVDADGDNLRSRAVVHELVDELAQERLERVRGHELVARRRRRGEKTRDVRLVGLHVPLQKRIQVKQVQPVQTDDARENLYEEHLGVELERGPALKSVEETLGERLRVVDELHRREASLAARALLLLRRASNRRNLTLQLLLFLLFRARHACEKGGRRNGTEHGTSGTGIRIGTNPRLERRARVGVSGTFETNV